MGENSAGAEPLRPRSGREIVTFAQLRDSAGAAPTLSGWHLIDQPMVNRFADVTGDHAYIHVDPERAAASRFGGTVAHGLLVLSLLPAMLHEATPLVRGTTMSANYGYDRVRFIAPVPVGSRVRGRFTLARIEPRGPGYFMLHYDITIEVEGQERPACSAHWMIARWMAEGAS